MYTSYLERPPSSLPKLARILLRPSKLTAKMLAVVSSCLSLMPRLPIRSAVASGRHALSMSAFSGPRQQEIEAKLSAVFSPVHLQVDNESHGRQEDECALACPTQTC